VVFLLTKLLLEKAPATRACPECQEVIPLAARKCRACGSTVQ
jgi:RNA polymerase subunit RPABC4/transcription elongation factor Spt4